MPHRHLATTSLVCAALVLLAGCAQQDPASAPQSTPTSSSIAADASEVASAGQPSQSSLEGIPLVEMTRQPVEVQMTQCLTQQARWVDLPGGKTSSDLYTRIAANEQELLFLLRDQVGGFDNVDVAEGTGPRGTVRVSVVGAQDGGGDAAATWRGLRDGSPEVEAAAAAIESEGASFSAEFVDFSYATLCQAELAVMALWTSNDEGLTSVRMDVERNRVILGVDEAMFRDAYRQQLLATAPAGVFEFEPLD